VINFWTLLSDELFNCNHGTLFSLLCWAIVYHRVIRILFVTKGNSFKTNLRKFSGKNTDWFQQTPNGCFLVYVLMKLLSNFFLYHTHSNWFYNNLLQKNQTKTNLFHHPWRRNVKWSQYSKIRFSIQRKIICGNKITEVTMFLP